MPNRHGMTLVELLVVIAIIGVLIGLLVPAVQASRESARCATCLNKLSQLALATQSFHEATGHLPSYWWREDPTNKIQPPDMEGAWLARLLPYLDQSATYAAMTTSATMSAGYTNVVVTPASPDYQPAQAAVYSPPVYGPPPPPIWIPENSTTGNTLNVIGYTYIETNTSGGYWYQPPAPVITPAQLITPAKPAVGTPPVYQQEWHFKGELAGSSLVLPLATCPSDSISPAAAGLIVANTSSPASTDPNFSLTNYQANYQAFVISTAGVYLPSRNTFLQCAPARFENIHDGLSNTILLAEGLRLCPNSNPAYNVYRLAFWSTCQYQYSHNFAVDWNGWANTAMFQSISNAAKSCPMRLQGLHRGSLNVAFADGSARTLSPSISHWETGDPNSATNPWPYHKPPLSAAWGAWHENGDPQVWDQLVMPNDGGAFGSF